MWLEGWLNLMIWANYIVQIVRRSFMKYCLSATVIFALRKDCACSVFQQAQSTFFRRLMCIELRGAFDGNQK